MTYSQNLAEMVTQMGSQSVLQEKLVLRKKSDEKKSMYSIAELALVFGIS